MTRKTINYTVTDEGRDKGKVFVLTELPASRAESWAARALLALMRSGAELPEGFERTGMAGMAQMGIKALAGLSWEVAEPLLAEMWECVQVMPDPTKPHVVRILIEDDIEEVLTRVKLRAEIWKLHTDFFSFAALSQSTGAQAAAASNSPNIRTSRKPSA